MVGRENSCQQTNPKEEEKRENHQSSQLEGVKTFANIFLLHHPPMGYHSQRNNNVSSLVGALKAIVQRARRCRAKKVAAGLRFHVAVTTFCFLFLASTHNKVIGLTRIVSPKSSSSLAKLLPKPRTSVTKSSKQSPSLNSGELAECVPLFVCPYGLSILFYFLHILLFPRP